MVRTGASSVSSRARSRKGRDLSETTAGGQRVIGMEVLQLVSAVKMMSLRTEASTNSLHPPYIWPSSVHAISRGTKLFLGNVKFYITHQETSGVRGSRWFSLLSSTVTMHKPEFVPRIPSLV